MCVVWKTLGSSVGEMSNEVTFATFLRQERVEVLLHKGLVVSLVLHREVTVTGIAEKGGVSKNPGL